MSHPIQAEDALIILLLISRRAREAPPHMCIIVSNLVIDSLCNPSLFV